MASLRGGCGCNERRQLVFVAEDDPSIRALLQDCLRDDGFLCIAYADGLALIKALGLVRPSAIVMDVRMPGLDGLGVMAHVRANALLCAIPVVAISADGDPEPALAAGCHAFLSKPFDLGELLGTLRHCLSEPVAR
jgi:CheY-like chemotaxis protein